MTDQEAHRLKRRYERERAARLEAEKIAEHGLRELYDANLELDDRVRERTAQLEAARKEAELANAAKTKFLASLSHELRTPLNGVIGMLELLEAFVEPAEGGRAVPPEQASEWLASAQSSARRLNRLVVRLLRFIDIDALGERGRLPEADVEVTVPELLDRATERWRLPCARAGQLLNVEPGNAMDVRLGSPAEVLFAIDELLANVTQHADPGSVRLRAELEGRRLRLTIADSGPGLAEEYQARDLLSDPTETEPSQSSGVTRRADTGAGLGLTIVRRVAEVLGGSSGISVVDGGTSAWIEIPAVL